jgi:hypothetical protein
VRVERIDEPDTGCLRLARRARPIRTPAGCVAGVLAFGDVASAQLGEAHLAGACGKKRAGACGDGPTRLAGEGRAGRDRLEVPATAAAADRAVKLDRDVAELAGHPVRIRGTAGHRDDRATDAGRHRDIDEVVLAAAGPVGRLAERGDVRVAVEERRQSESCLHVVRERHVTEIRTEVRRLDDRAGARVDWPGLEIPMPMIDARTSSGARSRAAMSAATHASTTAAGPSSLGVSVATRVSREPSGWTTAARIWVPPRSSARTRRDSRAKPRNRGLGSRAF